MKILTRKLIPPFLAAALLMTPFHIRNVHAETGPAEVPRPLVQEAVQSSNDAKVVTWDMIPEYNGHGYVDINDDVPFFRDEEITRSPFERYGSLDILGRCTCAFACVGPETLPTEERAADLSDVTPTGWKQAQYEGIDPENGNWLFNRCHLIGYQLTGENENTLNLVTGTRYMNVEGMLPFENSVADYVRGTGNHVMYRVTPVFKGEEMVCRGVLMEAQSVEDPLIRFCVFCYNIQPGITIDYKTGDSWKEGSDEEVHEERSYVLNVRSKKIHSPDCEAVREMKKKNRKNVTAVWEDLLKEGYRPCGICGGGNK